MEYYSDAYKMSVRAVWYTNGCPSIKKFVEMKLIPADEQGRTANAYQITHWFDDESWTQWRDVMNAELSVQIEKRMMTDRMRVIKKQLVISENVIDKAYTDIMEKGFDSSASAVQALKNFMVEQRGLMQIDKMIQELAEKDTIDIQKEFKELAERAGLTMVEGEIKEEDSAEPIDT